MINLRKTLNDAHAILEKEGILRALIGSFALAAYGIHRATVDIDLFANRPLSQEMIKQARANPHLGVHILRPEDILGLKIQAYKNDFSREHQDKADIQSLLQLKCLDMNLIRKYADLFGEWAEIERLRARI